jgi:uncharacterized protein (DUF2141 family)
MTQKLLILATILCFFAFGQKATGATVNLTTCHSTPHQINSNISIVLNISGSFHHYHAYIRNVNNLNTSVATLTTDRTSSSLSATWYANSTGTYRVVVVVYDASGNELVNTKNDSSYNLEVKSGIVKLI